MGIDSYEQLGASAGYEVGRWGSDIVLIHRATRGPALVAWICGGLSVLAGLHTLLWSSLAIAGNISPTQGAVAGVVLLVLTIGLFLVARTGYRAYRRRRDAPWSELPGYRADLHASELRAGEVFVAKLTEVSVDTPRNLGDSTQGSMRWVRLRWPGGSTRVYSASSAESERVADLLRSLFATPPTEA